MNTEQQKSTISHLTYAERKRREEELFNEYCLLDEGSLDAFNAKLNANVKFGWRPYGKHAIYLDKDGSPHYTILMCKSILDKL